MPDPRTTIRTTTADLGDLDLGDTLVAVVELEVMDAGRRRNGKVGTVDYRHAVIKDVLRLEGDLPEELLVELRRQRREAEEETTGARVVPGLEGWLDGAGVVVTEADRGVGAPDPSAAWVALGERVHDLRAWADDAGPKDPTYREELDALFVVLNGIVPGEEVIEADDGDLVIIGLDGEARDAIALPDLERPAERATEGAPPWAGYDDLDLAGILEHLDDYLDADVALTGGASATAAETVARALGYERRNGKRGPVIKALEERLKAIEAARKTTPAAEPDRTLEEPIGGYTKLTADRIIEHLKALADVDDPDAVRRVVADVEAFELAHKARKGVLNRLAGIVPPPMPDGPDLDLELDDDDLETFEPNDDDRTEQEV